MIVARGLHDGIERTVSILMPALFAMMLFMIGYAAVAGDFPAAMDFLFSFDFSKIDAGTVLTAIGQAFFSVSVAMGLLIAYGSYLSRDVSIPQASLIIAGADTLVALLPALTGLVETIIMQPERMRAALDEAMLATDLADYLVSTGVDAGKLRVTGRGKNDPVASNDTPEGRSQNRRVDIVVVAEPRALDTIRFPSVALFPRRSADITDQGRAILEKNREASSELLRRASYIEVVGHTDDVGDDAYNQELSEQRAMAVRDYLVAAGVDGSKIATVGMGESMPVASNTTDEGRAENRRVDVLVPGWVT